ncbi:MAG: serine protease, partial [Actinobacteria bacterium]
MKTMLTALVAGALLLVLAGGAGAITYGVPDGNGHPEVGALLAQH